MIRKFIEKRKIKRAFEKLVTPERVKEVLRDGFRPMEYRHGRIEFILAFVRGDNPFEISKHLSRVSELASACGAMNHSAIGALAIVAFGTHPTSRLEHGVRLSLVQTLQQDLAQDIKIVHGAAEGHYGILGEDPSSYTFLVPQFDQALGKLSQLEFGENAELIPLAE